MCLDYDASLMSKQKIGCDIKWNSAFIFSRIRMATLSKLCIFIAIINNAI